jgi:hypothetical protein
MIKFENVKVYNWLNALRGMRNSWESWDKLDSVETVVYENLTPSIKFEMGIEDQKLALKLSKAGSDHGKYLRQILVSVDVIAPEYWWKEADTYKVGTVANSTSMMHKLGARELTVDDFSFDNPNHPTVLLYMGLINTVREEWVRSGKKKPSPEWRTMNQLTAIAFNYRRTFTCNYQVLKSMYHSRKNHRLQEWHDFASWVESLPYSELITLKGEKSREKA